MRALIYVAVLVVVIAATIGVLLLLQNIFTRKREAEQVVFSLVDLKEGTIDPAEWGKNFPRQFDSYQRTVDIARTRFGGSEAFQKLDEDPVWREIFAGYAFSIDYREERGHAYMLSDQRDTERVLQRQQPGACLHCHASVTEAYRQQGHAAGIQPSGGFDWPAVTKGFEVVCGMSYAQATALVSHPVSCVDCHDPHSMQLRVTRPAFVNGMQALAESGEPMPHLPSIERWRAGAQNVPYDPNTLASRAEMRSLVCAQCHVEYYFKGDGKLLTYPWHKGLKVGQIEAYYDEVDWKDWLHAQSGAPVLKAQHPEFETWSQGIHARSGVSCADCHMPYKREGAIKISDHHIRSPLLNINHSCQTCHRYPESEILDRAEAVQQRTRELMNRAEDAVVDLIRDIEAALAKGSPASRIHAAQALQRAAQWRLDFVSAENSMGFHAPQESAKTLAESIDLARQGQLALAIDPPNAPTASTPSP